MVISLELYFFIQTFLQLNVNKDMGMTQLRLQRRPRFKSSFCSPDPTTNSKTIPMNFHKFSDRNDLKVLFSYWVFFRSKSILFDINFVEIQYQSTLLNCIGLVCIGSGEQMCFFDKTKMDKTFFS